MTTHPDGPSAAPAWRPALPRLPLALALTAVGLGALSLLLPNIAPNVEFMAAPGSPVRMFFGVSQEMNLPTAFSVGVMAAAALAHGLNARLVRGSTGTAMLVVAALLAMLAFDDFAAIHERLNAISGGTGSVGYTWVIPASLVAAVVVVAIVRLALKLPARARRDLLIGIGIFLGAAFGLETVSSLLDRPGTDGAPLQLVTHLEEVTENLGAILMLRAALSLLEVSRGRAGFAVRLTADVHAQPGPEHSAAPNAAPRVAEPGRTGAPAEQRPGPRSDEVSATERTTPLPAR